MSRQERKNTTEPCWARRIFTRPENKAAKIGEKMLHILSYNLYQNGDHRHKRSVRKAVARGAYCSPAVPALMRQPSMLRKFLSSPVGYFTVATGIMGFAFWTGKRRKQPFNMFILMLAAL